MKDGSSCDRQGCLESVRIGSISKKLDDGCWVTICHQHQMFPEELNLPGVFFHDHYIAEPGGWFATP